MAFKACTAAQAIRCVNDTLPPRERRRWLLITVRLSISSLAGTARTLVAVGTANDASMLVTTRAAGPRRTVVSTSFPTVVGAVGAGGGAAWGAAAWGAAALGAAALGGVSGVNGTAFAGAAAAGTG